MLHAHGKSCSVLAAALIALATSAGAGAAENGFWYGDQLPTPLAPMLFRYMVTPSPDLQNNPPISVLLNSLMNYKNWGQNGEGPGLKVYKQGETWDGYTLLSSLGGHLDAAGTLNYAILIDMKGNIVREWPYAAFPAKMLPGGFLVASEGDVPGHQEYQRLLELDWCGREVWSYAGEGEGGARVHHDWQREGSSVGYYSPTMTAKPMGGKTLILSHFNPDPSLTQNITNVVESDGRKRGLEDDALYEVDWNGKVRWSWFAYQHVEQMGFDPLARESIRVNKIRAPANIGGGVDLHDWQHLNSASYLGPNKWYDKGDERFHPENIIVDGRSSNLIMIIARHDDRQGRWKSGDIVWTTGPHYYYGKPGYKVGQIIGQHHAHMIPPGLPGAGNILVFDNGGLAGYGSLFPGAPAFWPTTFRDYSRVIEYNPQTLEVVWEYSNLVGTSAARKFFSWYISSAQRLPNGNTMITEGGQGRIFEVTSEGEIVWEYISPYADRDPIEKTAFGNHVYRAYRIPNWWVPLDKHCPTPLSNAKPSSAKKPAAAAKPAPATKPLSAAE